MTHARSRAHGLGDFTTDWRVIPISGLAIVIGLIATGMAWVLLRLIGVFTNLAYYHRWGTALVSPAANSLGLVGSAGACWRIHHRGTDGALWIGTHSRARHS